MADTIPVPLPYSDKAVWTGLLLILALTLILHIDPFGCSKKPCTIFVLSISMSKLTGLVFVCVSTAVRIITS